MFLGTLQTGVIEVLDITRENIDVHCKKLCIPRLEDLKTSVMIELTEPEVLLILGGDQVQQDIQDDFSES